MKRFTYSSSLSYIYSYYPSGSFHMKHRRHRETFFVLPLSGRRLTCSLDIFVKTDLSTSSIMEALQTRLARLKTPILILVSRVTSNRDSCWRELVARILVVDATRKPRQSRIAAADGRPNGSIMVFPLRAPSQLALHQL